MKNLKTFNEYLLETKEDPLEQGLYSKPGKGAVKGTGYKDAAAANKTVEIIDKLKKTDFKHAMSIATTMENRAKTHAHPTPEMGEAAKILRKWIDANKRS